MFKLGNDGIGMSDPAYGVRKALDVVNTGGANEDEKYKESGEPIKYLGLDGPSAFRTWTRPAHSVPLFLLKIVVNKLNIPAYLHTPV
ncbi:MAG: hypothetical protein ABI475_03415 [Methylophilaceae bacterium]